MNFKKIVATIIFLLSSNSFAQFKIGLYEGDQADGSTCGIYFQSKNFRYNVPNPINEEVTVKLNSGEIFITGHSSFYDSTTDTINYEKNVLSSTRGTKEGAITLRILIEEVNATEAPSKYSIISNNWTDNSKKIIECSNLVYKGRN